MLAETQAASGLGMVVFVLIGTTTMLMLLRRHQFRRVTGRDVAREQLARLRDQQGVRNSMDDLMIQLEELQRRINAQLDTKFARLEATIADADKRIQELRDLAESSPKPPETDAPQVTPTSSAPPEPPVENRTPVSDQHRRVYAMHDAGSTPVEMAEALGLPLGEVEVILQLRQFS